MENLDVSEQFLFEYTPKVLKNLLSDKTTGKNILWATEDYAFISFAHQAHAEITVSSITGEYSGIISPRTVKPLEQQNGRTRERAEVFTPSWLCNVQNNLVDEAWFGRTNVFNTPVFHDWQTSTNPILFIEKPARSWKNYVDEKRLEITCGEAPYLVSRYDATTGKAIKLNRRIGLLDRKMRVVGENVSTEEDWLKWAERAFQSVYGFEFQGDSLLLARENLLASYRDYMRAFLKRDPTSDELERIAHIISWNIWQMDAFTGTIPYKAAPQLNQQTELFSTNTETSGEPCRIKDWRAKKTITYLALISES